MSPPEFLGMPTYAPRGVGALHGRRPFPDAARDALADSQLRRNLEKATSTIRAKRAAVVAELPDWEALRQAGAAIKAATMSRLDEHLERLEREVTARGDLLIQRVNGHECARFMETNPERPRSGVIALQYHAPGGFEVRFRNLRLVRD